MQAQLNRMEKKMDSQPSPAGLAGLIANPSNKEELDQNTEIIRAHQKLLTTAKKENDKAKSNLALQAAVPAQEVNA